MVGPHCCDCLKPNKAEKHIEITTRRNLPKTFSVPKVLINLLNFSLKNIWQAIRKLFGLIFTKD